ncbi:alpha/beta fold hydrolase [Dactylosporangium sp. CA-092794]|uniref:alpha/beta fold hydrolase n=1 Tax=Dactylosporangium sp. CA-092794 TaxID=3239929 RepID=UPI003D8D8748
MSSELTYDNTHRIVDTADYRIQINEAGEGYPVFLIHGTGPGATGWSNFAPNIPALAQKYRVIAVTMPGWGESSPQDLTTGRDQGKAMLQLMDTLGIERAAYVGNSMGGGITFIMGANHPERVSHMITMGAGVWGTPLMSPAGLSEGMRALFDAYRDPTPENFKRIVQVMCYDQSFASDELAKQRSDAALEFPEHNSNWLELWGTPAMRVGTENLEQLLQKTTIPALIIHGRDDRTVHWEMSLRAMTLIPNSRLVLLNRCGHWAQLEHADEFNRIVDHFITDN